MEILLSSHCPIWYGYGGHLKWLERVAYINATICPLMPIPLFIYCTLPAVLLLTGKFIIPMTSNHASMWIILLFLLIFSNVVLESRWSAVTMQEWWRNQQFWVITSVSSHLFAVLQCLIKDLTCSRTGSSEAAMKSDNDNTMDLYRFKWTSLLIMPTTLVLASFWQSAVAIGLGSYYFSGSYLVLV